MEENIEIVDQSKLAESVAEKINYEFRNQFLVKPLDPVMVEKEFSKPIPTNSQETTDENGIEATDYDEVATEIKSVPSDYRKGVVIKVPAEYKNFPAEYKNTNFDINPGDIVIYREGAGRWFDLCKDTQLVEMYSIIGITK